MKKIFSLILSALCIFSLNICFQVNSVYAVDTTAQEFAQDNNEKIVTESDDILSEPVFKKENETKEHKNSITKISSLIVKIGGYSLLGILVLICCAFIWFADIQHRRDKRKQKQGADPRVIDAVDNFTKRRIK